MPVRTGRIAAASALLGGLSAYAGPALAATSGSVAITYGTTAGCTTCRTLVLTNTDGSPLTTLDLSPGSNGFIAEVVDSGVDPAALGNFSVGSTMSDLYAYDAGTATYNCGVSILSSDLTLDSAPALLNASNLSASLQPVFTVSGDISSLITPTVQALLPGITIDTTPTITDIQGDVDSALTQAAEAANSTNSILVGTLLANLPMTLSTGTGGAFTNPAAPPSGSGCTGTGSNATSVPVLNGALPASSPLLGDLQAALASMTVTQMINQGFLTANQAETLIESATNITSAVFNSDPALLTSIEDTLTGSVTGIVSSATTISGQYAAAPVMAIGAPGASPASYQGVLTVTLTSP